MKRLLATLLLRCPICLEGKVFTGLLAMHKTCPQCGVIFEREHGYFLNSMLIAYTAGFLLLLPTAVWMALSNVSMFTFATVIILETTLLWPLIFRYSRLIWMHVDQALDPRSS